MQKSILILLVLLSLINAGGVGTTGANYLKIGLGAKASAMGENFTALADDYSATYWNPAGLANAKGNEVDFMQLNWLAGISSKTISGIHPISDTDTLGGYIFILDTPMDKETQFDPNTLDYVETGDKFNSSVSVIDLAYSKKLSPKLFVGAGLKSIGENLAGVKANGLAMDVGLLYLDFWPSLSLGAAVKNIGISKLRSSEDLPMIISVGAAYKLNILNKRTTILLDASIPNDNVPVVGLGSEVWLADILALRMGYNNLHKMTLGLGLKLDNFSADYAYLPIEDLGVTHRISVGYNFSMIKAAEPKAIVPAPEKVEVEKVDFTELAKPVSAPETKPEVKPLVVPQVAIPTAAPKTEPLVTTASHTEVLKQFDKF